MEFDIEFLVNFKSRSPADKAPEAIDEILTKPVPVAKGQVVAREMEAGKTHPDKKRGVRVRMPKGNRAQDIMGGNLQASNEDPSVIVSQINGFLCARDDFLTVTQHYEIFGDVGPLTGDVYTENPARIHGGVIEGYKFESKGDVEILGLVEAASVKSGRNLFLKGGMAGGGSGEAIAGKDIYVKFVQQSHLEATGSIIIDGPAMNCDLNAGKKITIRGRGALVGGISRAKEEIHIPTLGSEGAIPTEVIVGNDPFLDRKKAERLKKMAAFREEKDEKDKEVEFASANLAGVVEIHKGDLLSNVFHLSDIFRKGDFEQFDHGQKELFAQMSAAILDLIRIEDGISALEQDDAAGEGEQANYKACLKVDNFAHPGVKITIVNQSTTLSLEREHVRFILSEGEIKEAGI